jgi:hypothetical protein
MPCSPAIRLLLVAALLLGCLPNAFADRRTATISVSATVVASCRVEAATQVASIQASSARGYCSGSTAPITRAVLERDGDTARLQPVSQVFSAVSAEDGKGPARVRLDVLY